MVPALVLVALLVVVQVTSAQSGGAQADTDRIAIDAESISYDQRTDTVTATGDVVIQRGSFELRAGRVEVNRTSGDATAAGGVELTDSESTLVAEDMTLNLETETGVLTNGRLQSSRLRYRLLGDRIEKAEGQRYRIENGNFTTCICPEEPPSWSIAADHLDVEVGRCGALRGGTFNVLDWPVVYLPRAVFPVATERQSGLLLPKFAFSNRRGFQTIIPAYAVFNRSHDATIAFDFESGARVGLLGEYRFALGKGTGGEVAGAYFNELFRSARDLESTDRPVADPTIPEHRWSVTGHHDQRLPLDSTGFVDVFLVSDDLFLREINAFTLDYRHDTAIRTQRYTESRIGALHTWNRAAMLVQGRYYQDVIGDDDLALQRLPEVRLWGQRALGGSMFGTFGASATSFQRRQGIDGLRLDIYPKFTIPIRTGLPLRAEVRMGIRETAYALTESRMRGGLDPSSQAAWVLDLPASVSRETAELGGEVSTEISRIYSIGGEHLQRLKHTIEPVIAYYYVPDITQNDLPIFDGVDRINHRNLVTYGVVSRVFGKFSPAKDESTDASPTAGTVRQLAALALFQSYDVNRQIAPVGIPPGGQGSDQFSDIDLLVSATPLESMSVLVRSSYDTGHSDISAAGISVQLSDPRPSARSLPTRLSSRTAISIGYRFITQNVLQQLDASFFLHLTDYLGALLATRYDVQNAQVLDNHFGFRLLSRCDCWGLDVAVSDRTNPKEIELRAQLTIVGLGSGSALPSGIP